MSENIYRQYDVSCLYSPQYMIHIDRMTREHLRNKSDIAAELAARDIRIADLERQLAEAEMLLLSADYSPPVPMPSADRHFENRQEWLRRRRLLLKALSGEER